MLVAEFRGTIIFLWVISELLGFLDSSVGKESATQETLVGFLDQEDPLEKGKATHSSILVWEIPWIEEPGGLQSIQLQRVRHNLETKQQEINSLLLPLL